MPKTRRIPALIGTLLVCTALVQAVDRKLKPIADGDQDPYYRSGSGTSSRLHAESDYYNGRRIVLMFDTRLVSTYQLRRATLYLFGGCKSGGGSVNTNVYHYGSDAWGESLIPYPDYGLRYLAGKTVSNPLSADYIGTSQWHAFDIGANLTGWDSDGYLSLAVRSLSTSGATGISFVSRNSVPWDGSKGKEPYIEFGTYGAVTIQSGTFAEGFAEDWIVVSGGGTATTVDNPYDPGTDELAELTAGSPVTISQVLDTPAEPFYVVFDYEFTTTTGSLEVSLTDRYGIETVLGSLTAPAVLAGGMSIGAFHVTDAGLFALDNATLSLTLDGATGSQVWLDNVAFSDVPEPAAMALLALGGMACLLRRRRR